jgi:poly-gamma-glutamate synthesis protein (capsule biosynthesis protein)
VEPDLAAGGSQEGETGRFDICNDNVLRTCRFPALLIRLLARFLALTIVLLASQGLAQTPVFSSTLTLAFVGDVMLGRGIEAALQQKWSDAFSDVAPWLTSAQLAVANLESPLTRAPYVGGHFDLRASPEAVVALTAGGFDLVSIANNHILDGGESGAAETVQTLGLAKIEVVGDTDCWIYEWRHLRVCFFALLDKGQPMDFDILSWRVTQIDLVVVSVHWGAEYYPVTDRQRILARQLIKAGADVVIGHGPHVLQTVEWVDGALVAYSLGNFLFDQPFADTQRGAILRIMIERGSIVAFRVVPTIVKHGRVRVAVGADADAILDQMGTLAIQWANWAAD